MTRFADPPRDLRRVTSLGALATGFFAIGTWLTTQVAAIRAALPLGVDPRDWSCPRRAVAARLC